MLEKNNMRWISLTSDYGLNDGSIARIKAKLLRQSSLYPLIDISHTINPFDLYETAYVFNESFEEFPEDSIHLIWVGALEHRIENAICARYKNRYIIVNNNGFLSLLAKNQPIVIKSLPQKELNREDLFIQSALELQKGDSFFQQLPEEPSPKEVNAHQPTVTENSLTGSIVYINRFGNAISNIKKELFEEVAQNRKFEIHANNDHFSELVENYSDVVKDYSKEGMYIGRSMALFNAQDHLEIALYKSNHNSVGGASQLLKLGKGQKIIIQFQ